MAVVSEIVQILHEIRRERRLSYQRLANASHVFVTTLSNWEHGKNSPSLSHLEAVLDTLGYELEVVRKEQKKPIAKSPERNNMRGVTR